MKLATLAARLTICSALAGFGLASQSAGADSPSRDAQPAAAQMNSTPAIQPGLFGPVKLAPHFALHNTGLWNEYRGAAIEHDPAEARQRLTGQRPRRVRPLLSLLAWLERLFMPAANKPVACAHCPLAPPPAGQGLEYDELPGEAESSDADLLPGRPAPDQIPERRGPDYPPVVELAPEPVLPADQRPPLPPRNRVPQPGPRPPKNLVPR